MIEIRASTEARLAYLLRDYNYLGDDPQQLSDKLGWLKKELQGNETVRPLARLGTDPQPLALV